MERREKERDQERISQVMEGRIEEPGLEKKKEDIMAKEREELRRLASLTDSEGSQKLSREDKYDDSRKAAKRRRQERGGTMEGLAGTGFTAEDIDTLIVEAREKASGAEGSSQAWRHGDSHEETEFKLHHLKGASRMHRLAPKSFTCMCSAG